MATYLSFIDAALATSSFIEDCHNSPPSLTSSEFTVDTEDDMASIPAKEDVTEVMSNVVSHLRQVAEHLRSKGENDAANSIAKDVMSIIETFRNATAPWDIQQCLMDPIIPPQRTITIPSQSNAAIASPLPLVAAGSWAKVAATEIGENNHLVKFRPRDGIKRIVRDLEPTPDPQDLRVVWVHGWEKDRHFYEATDRCSHGALLSVAFAPAHGALCMIFQFAASARALLDDDEQCIRLNGIPILGENCPMIIGHPYPEDDDLRLMAYPTSERRRLTFARQQLFAQKEVVDAFKKDIHEMAGEQNIELIWFFNTGNATVVFSSTSIARVVKNEFRNRAKVNGPYKDVQVSFSHDPCERSMNLITQIPGGDANARPRSGSIRILGVGGARPRTKTAPNAPLRQGSSISRAPIVDADGWQTVTRKR